MELVGRLLLFSKFLSRCLLERLMGFRRPAEVTMPWLLQRQFLNACHIVKLLENQGVCFGCEVEEVGFVEDFCEG